MEEVCVPISHLCLGKRRCVLSKVGQSNAMKQGLVIRKELNKIDPFILMSLWICRHFAESLSAWKCTAQRFVICGSHSSVGCAKTLPVFSSCVHSS